MIEKDIEKVLISKEEILAKSAELGKQLTEEYQGKNPLVVGILKGAVPVSYTHLTLPTICSV